MKRKSGMVLGVLAGLATCAQAQSLSVHVGFDNTDLQVGESTTAIMTASFTTLSGDPESYFSFIGIDIFGVSGGILGNSFLASDLQFGSWHNPNTSNPPIPEQGEISGASILGFVMSQHQFNGDVDTTTTGLLVASWTITRQNTGSFSYQAGDVGFPNPFVVIDRFGVIGSVDRYELDAFSSDSISMIPSPASLGVLGIGLAFAGRRRRA